MAKATAHRAPPPPLPPIEKVTLELDFDEACTLRCVLAHVGGDPRTTRRGDSDAIDNALDRIGVPWIAGGSTGGIRFE